MKTRAQVLAERKKTAPAEQTSLALPAPTTPLTLRELGAFVQRTGCSIHLRASGKKFVAHLASETRASDVEGPDLEAGLRTVMVDFER